MSTEEDETLVAHFIDRYHKAMHAVQSAIATILHYDSTGRLVAACDEGQNIRSPKHLRVGIDARASDAKGLAKLLIAKGVFTELEYVQAVTEALEEEAEEQAQRARTVCGLPDSTKFQ